MTDTQLSFIPKPMLAVGIEYDRIAEKAYGYSMELKLDGWRCLIVKNGQDLQAYSRTGKSFTEKIPDILGQLRMYDGDWILDGELGYIMPGIDYDDPFPIFDY